MLELLELDGELCPMVWGMAGRSWRLPVGPDAWLGDAGAGVRPVLQR